MGTDIWRYLPTFSMVNLPELYIFDTGQLMCSATTLKMRQQQLAPFLILLIVTGRTRNTHAQIYPINGLVGKKLVAPGTQFGMMYHDDVSWVQCARECFLRMRCTAINFKMKRATRAHCYHYDVTLGDETYVDHVEHVSGTVAMWKGEEFAGTCASRPCNINEKCLPAEPNYVCLPWCDMPKPPLNIEWAVTWHLRSWHIGCPPGIVLHRRQCEPRYMMPPQGLAATCQYNATWTLSDPQWACREIQDCVDVKQCSADFTDGVYSVINMGMISDVKCTDMASTLPITSAIVASGATVQIPVCPIILS